MTEADFEEMEQRERQAHDDKVKELQGQKSMTDEEKDLIQRAQDIQRYTENRCKTLEEKIAAFEKENEQLKSEKKELYQLYDKEADEMAKSYSERLKELEKENAELKEQIDQLSNDNHVLKTSFITQQAQIEKMKNCSNCNGIKPNGMRSEKCDFCFRGKDFIYWELAE